MVGSKRSFLKGAVAGFCFLWFFLAGSGVMASQNEPTPEELAGASPIEVGKEYTGELAGRDKGVFYKIPVVPGHELKIFYHNSDTKEQPVTLSYFRADGKKINDNFATVDGFLSYTPGKTTDNDRYVDNMVYFQIYFNSAVFKTVYSFKVTMNPKTDIGLETDVPDKLESAKQLEPGDYPNNFLAYTSVCSKYCSDDQKDFYKILVPAGLEVAIVVTPDSEMHVRAQIFKDDRSEVVNKTTSNPGQILNLNYTQEKEGMIYLAIGCRSGNCYGPYQFSVAFKETEVNGPGDENGPKDIVESQPPVVNNTSTSAVNPIKEDINTAPAANVNSAINAGQGAATNPASPVADSKSWWQKNIYWLILFLVVIVGIIVFVFLKTRAPKNKV